MYDGRRHEVRDISLALVCGKPSIRHDALGRDDHLFGCTGQQHVLVLRALDEHIALRVSDLRVDDGEVRPDGLDCREHLAGEGIGDIGKIVVYLAKVADLQSAHRHEGNAVACRAQGRNNGVAGVLVGFDQPLLHAQAVALGQTVVAFIADEAGVHSRGAAAHTQGVDVHRACGFDHPQVFAALTHDFKHGSHGRAVEGVAAKAYAVAVVDESDRFFNRTEFIHTAPHFAALEAICTASHTPAKGGA